MRMNDQTIQRTTSSSSSKLSQKQTKINNLKIEASLQTFTSSIIKLSLYDGKVNCWDGCGIVIRNPILHNEGKENDGICVLTTRHNSYNTFTSQNVRVTFYDPSTSQIILKNVSLDPNTFNYIPPLYKEEIQALEEKRKVGKGLSVSELNRLTGIIDERDVNTNIDVCVVYLPIDSRPADLNCISVDECMSRSEGESKVDEITNNPPQQVNIKDTLLLIQYPSSDIQTHQTPQHMLNVKVHKILGPKVYYRIDPTSTSHFKSGAVLLKLYPETAECRYQIIGIHVGRFESSVDCYEGLLLPHALERLKHDTNNNCDLFSKGRNTSFSTGMNKRGANVRKLSITTARKDLNAFLNITSKNDLGLINAERATDLFMIASHNDNITDVLTLLANFTEELDIQKVGIKTLIRMIVGDGVYVGQVARINEYGRFKLSNGNGVGLIQHTINIMDAYHNKSDELQIASLNLLGLLSRDMTNARCIGELGGCEAVCEALNGFTVFGRGSAKGQCWGGACVENLSRVTSNRSSLTTSGVLSTLPKLLNNSISIQNNVTCTAAILGAITEMSRSPYMECRKVLMSAGSSVHCVVWEIMGKFLEEKRILDCFEDGESEVGEEGGEISATDEDSEREDGNDEDGDPAATIALKSMFTQDEIELAIESSKECLFNLSLGIPSEMFKDACFDKKFLIDWTLVDDNFGSDSDGRDDSRRKEMIVKAEAGEVCRIRRRG